MSVASFVIYFDKKSKKLEVLTDYFMKEIVKEDGKVESVIVHTDGHEKLYNELKKMKVPMCNIIIKGLLFNENSKYSLGWVQTMNHFCMNSIDISYQANLKNISIMEERRNFSNLILDFVLGKVKEDKFRFVVENRIVGASKLFKYSNSNTLQSLIKDKQK